MKPFPLLIKPASADCNARCEYCFYPDRPGFRGGSGKRRMSDAVLEAMIKSYMSLPQPEYIFTWQGGEPTLMGADFFARVVALQQKYGARANATVGNGLQTNGIAIAAELARLMSDYRFLAGVSLDGPAEIHDRYRRTAGGEGTHAAAMRGIRLLREHGVAFNILVLVSRANVERAREVYRYLVENGFVYHQYVPCVEPQRGGGRPFSISGKEWGGFLCELFDEWRTGGAGVSVRLFDSIVQYLVDGRKTACTMEDDCRSYFVVEHNGDVYPCDFFVESQLKLGNVMSDGWEQMMESATFRAFGTRKRAMRPECGRCRWENLCAGDCLKHRPAGGVGAPAALSVLCDGWKIFYAHSFDIFMEIAGEIVNGA